MTKRRVDQGSRKSLQMRWREQNLDGTNAGQNNMFPRRLSRGMGHMFNPSSEQLPEFNVTEGANISPGSGHGAAANGPRATAASRMSYSPQTSRQNTQYSADYGTRRAPSPLRDVPSLHPPRPFTRPGSGASQLGAGYQPTTESALRYGPTNISSSRFPENQSAYGPPRSQFNYVPSRSVNYPRADTMNQNQLASSSSPAYDPSSLPRSRPGSQAPYRPYSRVMPPSRTLPLGSISRISSRPQSYQPPQPISRGMSPRPGSRTLEIAHWAEPKALRELTLRVYHRLRSQGMKDVPHDPAIIMQAPQIWWAYEMALHQIDPTVVFHDIPSVDAILDMLKMLSFPYYSSLYHSTLANPTRPDSWFVVAGALDRLQVLAEEVASRMRTVDNALGSVSLDPSMKVPELEDAAELLYMRSLHPEGTVDPSVLQCQLQDMLSDLDSGQRQEISKLELAVSEAETERDSRKRISDMYKDAKAAREAALADFETVNSEFVKASEEAETARKKLEVIESEIAQLQQRHAVLKELLDAADIDAQQIRNLEEQRSRLELRRESLNREIESLSTETEENLRPQLQRLFRDLEMELLQLVPPGADKPIAELDESSDSLLADGINFSRVSRTLVQLLQSSEKDARDSKRSLAVQSARVENLSRQRDSLEAEHAHNTAELAAAREKTAEIHASIASRRNADRERERGERERLKAEEDAISTDIARLQRELQDLNERNHVLDHQLDEAVTLKRDTAAKLDLYNWAQEYLGSRLAGYSAMVGSYLDKADSIFKELASLEATSYALKTAPTPPVDEACIKAYRAQVIFEAKKAIAECQGDLHSAVV